MCASRSRQPLVLYSQSSGMLWERGRSAPRRIPRPSLPRVSLGLSLWSHAKPADPGAWSAHQLLISAALERVDQRDRCTIRHTYSVEFGLASSRGAGRPGLTRATSRISSWPPVTTRFNTRQRATSGRGGTLGSQHRWAGAVPRRERNRIPIAKLLAGRFRYGTKPNWPRSRR